MVRWGSLDNFDVPTAADADCRTQTHMFAAALAFGIRPSAREKKKAEIDRRVGQE
jgi:hypothetical protein